MPNNANTAAEIVVSKTDAMALCRAAKTWTRNTSNMVAGIPSKAIETGARYLPNCGSILARFGGR